MPTLLPEGQISRGLTLDTLGIISEVSGAARIDLGLARGWVALRNLGIDILHKTLFHRTDW